ncbi:MAG: hypothetical protein ACRDGQ_11180, partial [Candidatus Limnocylindrales bacterium]
AWTTLHPPGAVLPIGGPPASVASGPNGGFLGLAGGFGGFVGSGPDNGSGSALVAFARAHQHDARFVLATANAGQAEAIIIATGLPVMALGGFNGSDQTLTVTQFQALVAAGDVRYVLVGVGSGGVGGGFGGGLGSAGGGARGRTTDVIRWARTACVPIRSGPLSGQIVDCQSASSSSSTGPKASIEPWLIGSSTSWTASMPARA